ncbi:ABC transporter ATP-binding protein/permease [Bittarella massiliensis]|nr:ABC transporter ATP-binding protein/permease [Bittarella massiliensis (ex Durand et al. 2017)]MBO1678736.1 ABC transporter ATP-binding protein/permease [Bittarella massiliensis (ex Durand et al. 2017)]
MMIDKRLIGAVPDSRGHVARNVLYQWGGLLASAATTFAFARLLGGLLQGAATGADLAAACGVGLLAMAVRWLCTAMAGRESFLASRSVKKALRRRICNKLLRLGPSCAQRIPTSEVVQVTTEGVEQLETYFGAYLPQFFYSLLAPLTLFALLFPISWKAAVALLLCVPLIPAAIAAVQTMAKKLLSRYWGQYTALGDTFLENLQGLTTLKIYGADGRKNEEMNREAEQFRRITMKVLTMQLNSITIMDLVAFGGAALGMILAVGELAAGTLSFAGCLAVLLLSADFFIPMRQLGSFFHVAMNGMAASGKIFALLDLPEDPPRRGRLPGDGYTVCCRDLSFGYEPGRPVLQGVSLDISSGALTAVVGESGCGKSTLAALLTGRCRGYGGQVRIGGVELDRLSAGELARTVTYVGFASYLFSGTVAENLRMGCPKADDAALWRVLERTRMADFLRGEQGLETHLDPQGANLSGGQRQRLALARALLHDTPIYIFDEATSNIDVESENDIMAEIHALAGEKTVLLISHRLANVAAADYICVLEGGRVAGWGNHLSLLAEGGRYRTLWAGQQQLEEFAKGGAAR